MRANMPPPPLRAFDARQLHDAYRQAVRRAPADDARADDRAAAEAARSALEQLGAAFGYPVFDLARMSELQADFKRLPLGEAGRRQCLLLRNDAGVSWLVISDPLDVDLLEWAQESIGSGIGIALADTDHITLCRSAHEQSLRAIDSLSDIPAGNVTADAEPQLSLRSISEEDSPIVRLVDSTLFDALRAGVSDIHLETTPEGLVIKYRLDGVLDRVARIDHQAGARQAISRIKVMAELDIAERRVPQDGRFRIAAEGREIDVRVSIMPSIHGEDAVLRILDRRAVGDSRSGLRLDGLGLDAGDVARIRSLAAQPYGMLLVTGPTGSGKTTTLYASISEIDATREKIITIEDPVEYQLPGVLQIPVNEKKGLTFARGLRSVLRHDPDRIMVGEIRDAETAQIAIQAALTGHLVFTTVHANSAFDVIGRFAHMQIDPYNLVGALNGIVAQRLIRRLCARCSQPDPGTQPGPRGPRGCVDCRGTGYRGRRAIAELLVMSDEMRELIVARAPLKRLREAARASGARFLREQALDLVARGETSIQEANRVTLVG